MLLRRMVIVVWFPVEGERKRSISSGSKRDGARNASLNVREVEKSDHSGHTSDVLESAHVTEAASGCH